MATPSQDDLSAYTADVHLKLEVADGRKRREPREPIERGQAELAYNIVHRRAHRAVHVDGGRVIPGDPQVGHPTAQLLEDRPHAVVRGSLVLRLGRA